MNSANVPPLIPILNQELEDSAYQLFIQEAVELFQQIEMDLQNLTKDPSLDYFRLVIRSIQIIHSGATQLKLTNFQTSVQRLEAACLQLQQQPSSTSIKLLSQASQTLKLALLTHVQNVPDTGEIDCAAAHTVLEHLEEHLSQLTPQKTVAQGTTPSATQLTALALATEVEVALQQLESTLASPNTNIIDDLTFHLKSLRDLGEMSDLFELIAISQTALTSLQTSPQSAPTIGQIALAGYRAIHERVPPNKLAVENKKPETRTKQSGTTLTLLTANAFVWQTGTTIFILPSLNLVEILNPSPGQVEQTETNCQLKWQDQKIPVYTLSHLMRAALPTLKVPSPISLDPPLLPFLITQYSDQLFALQVNIERLITTSKLEVQSSNSEAPPYHRGILLTGDPRPAIIDVEALLSETLDLVSKIH